jgi:hypothetical protein
MLNIDDNSENADAPNNWCSVWIINIVPRRILLFSLTRLLLSLDVLKDFAVICKRCYKGIQTIFLKHFVLQISNYFYNRNHFPLKSPCWNIVMIEF